MRVTNSHPPRRSDRSQLVQPHVKAATVSKIQEAFTQASDLEWMPSAPPGLRFVRVPLAADSDEESAKFAAMIPVGAKSPKAHVSDPNQAGYFFVERTRADGAVEFSGSPIELA